MRLNYRPDIDGLRAVAVLAVLAFHAFPTVVTGGFVGVDVFFVISGYLISSILLGEAQEARMSVWGFYARRILRIFPALIAVLTTCFFAGWYTLLAPEYKQLGKHIFAGATFVSNLALWWEAGYFDKASELKPLLHLWSLGIEEQFYIVWPLLLLGILKFRRHAVALTALVLLISLLWACYLVFEDRTQAFYSPTTRAWELLAGAVLALMEGTQHSWTRRFQHPAFSWIGLTLVGIAVLMLNPSNRFPGGWALLPVAGAFLLIAAAPNAWVNRRLLAHPALVKIGLISYPLYLWHWPLLSFATILEGGTPSLGMRTGLLVVAFLLASLTYVAIEKPVRKLPKKVAIPLLVVLMAVLGLLGKNIYDRDGLERVRYKKIIALEPEVQRDFLEWGETGLLPKTPCATPFQFPGSVICLTTHPERAPTAATVGDSHSFHGYWGLSRALDEQGENLVLLGRGACMPFVGYKLGNDDDKCQPHIDDTLAWISDQDTIKKVFFTFRGRYLSNQSSEAEHQRLEMAMDSTFKNLLGAGKQVYLLMPVSEPGFDPRLCVGSLPMGRRSAQLCNISREADLAKRQDLMQVMAKVLRQNPAVVAIDPSDYLCQGDICPVVQEGKSVFKDENHLSYSGSILLGQRLLRAGVLK